MSISSLTKAAVAEYLATQIEHGGFKFSGWVTEAQRNIVMEALRAYDPVEPVTYRIEHDGFEGVQIGSYRTLEGKEGVVLQQNATRVVHVYGRKWLNRVDS
jgi:hypothetical protein